MMRERTKVGFIAVMVGVRIRGSIPLRWAKKDLAGAGSKLAEK